MNLETNGKKYKVIYADPPWEIKSMVLDKWKSPLSDKYNTMSFDDIKKIPVNNVSDDDCSLFLWATHTYLEKAFELIREWGFKYHCCITWDKISGFSLCGFHRRTEFCLFAYKGKLNINQKGKFIPTIIVEKSKDHSRKPKQFHALIENNTPEPRLELFARDRREGWEYYGNQLSKTVQKRIT